MISEDHLFHGHALPNNKRSWNATNFAGAGLEYPEGTAIQRIDIEKKHLLDGLGILFFLQNDDMVSPTIREQANNWGIAKDEFVGSNHLPPVIYIRESRRLIGAYTFVEDDCKPIGVYNRTPIKRDSIAITEFPLDSLDCSTERIRDSLCDGQYFLMEDSRPGQIPYNITFSMSILNLLCPTTCSTSHVAWGTVRQNPTLIHLTEAVGFAGGFSNKVKNSAGAYRN